MILPLKKTSYNKDIYKGHILSAIESIKTNNANKMYKILNVNDTNTDILEEIYDTLLQKTHKYNIKTVSISTLFNPSFFSKHYCSKLRLSDYTSDMIKKEHETFDVIVLNDILTYTNDPLDVLKSCEKLSNQNTIVFSINIHTRVFSSLELFNLDKNVNSIFNTNSMRRLCYYSGMQLSNCTIIDNWNLFTLKRGVEKDSSKIIIDTLYTEMITNIYNKQLYTILSDYLEKYKHNLQNTILKYKSIDYKIVEISILEKDFMYLNFYKDYHINSNNLDELRRLDKDEKYIIIIYDYLNFNEIKTQIKRISNKNFLFFDICNFISYN
jgi:ATP-dependent Clp protease adapter protein ClpS